MIKNKLLKQMEFIVEIEKLKIVYRQNGVLGGGRQENSAEHSWHIALMAIILQEYSKEKIDVLKVVKMLLLHDIVEIYTGDTFLYDSSKRESIKLIEKEAANKAFSLLPESQRDEFMSLWNEFEENKTNEAKYALVLDNLQPILNHYYTNNQNIRGKMLTKTQVIEKKAFIQDFSKELWDFALSIIEKSAASGLFVNK